MSQTTENHNPKKEFTDIWLHCECGAAYREADGHFCDRKLKSEW